MLEGLRETAAALAGGASASCCGRGAPDQVALELARRRRAIVCDRGYLRHQRRWRRQVADQADCEVIEVEADAVVPVEAASDKAEYAARTLRPRIHRLLDQFLHPCPRRAPRHAFAPRRSLRGLALEICRPRCATLDLDASVPAVPLPGGTAAALARLRGFLRQGLPGLRRRSRAGRRLVRVAAQPLSALRADLAGGGRAGSAGQRRRRAGRSRRFPGGADRPPRAGQNFVCTRRTTTASIRARAGRGDAGTCTRRPPTYALHAATSSKRARPHDRALERRHARDARHRLHAQPHAHVLGQEDPGMDRRSAGSGIRDWRCGSTTSYFLDGRDANSYANVAWIFGLHDRPLAERPLFGKVRSMTAAGLERKSICPPTRPRPNGGSARRRRLRGEAARSATRRDR